MRTDPTATLSTIATTVPMTTKRHRHQQKRRPQPRGKRRSSNKAQDKLTVEFFQTKKRKMKGPRLCRVMLTENLSLSMRRLQLSFAMVAASVHRSSQSLGATSSPHRYAERASRFNIACKPRTCWLSCSRIFREAISSVPARGVSSNYKTRETMSTLEHFYIGWFACRTRRRQFEMRIKSC